MEGILKFPQDTSLLVSPLLERPLLDIWKTAGASVDHQMSLSTPAFTGYWVSRTQQTIPPPFARLI